MSFKESLAHWYSAEELKYNLRLMDDVFSFLATCVNDTWQPTITTCFLHTISEFSNYDPSQERKCFIQVLAEGRKKILLSKSFQMPDYKNSPLSARELEVNWLY